jgi:hypothetical protein
MSPPSSLRNMDIDPGSDRQAAAQPLYPFELVQGPIECSFETRLVSQQAIQPRGLGNAMPKNLQFRAFGFDRRTFSTVLAKTANLSIDFG